MFCSAQTAGQDVLVIAASGGESERKRNKSTKWRQVEPKPNGQVSTGLSFIMRHKWQHVLGLNVWKGTLWFYLTLHSRALCNPAHVQHHLSLTTMLWDLYLCRICVPPKNFQDNLCLQKHEFKAHGTGAIQQLKLPSVCSRVDWSNGQSSACFRSIYWGFEPLSRSKRARLDPPGAWFRIKNFRNWSWKLCTFSLTLAIRNLFIPYM